MIRTSSRNIRRPPKGKEVCRGQNPRVNLSAHDIVVPFDIRRHIRINGVYKNIRLWRQCNSFSGGGNTADVEALDEIIESRSSKTDRGEKCHCCHGSQI